MGRGSALDASSQADDEGPGQGRRHHPLPVTLSLAGGATVAPLPSQGLSVALDHAVTTATHRWTTGVRPACHTTITRSLWSHPVTTCPPSV